MTSMTRSERERLADNPPPDQFVTQGGIDVLRSTQDIPISGAVENLIDSLDGHRGILLASSYEYPGRYTRWDVGFCDPPIQIVATGRHFQMLALNLRGRALLPAIAAAASCQEGVVLDGVTQDACHGSIALPSARFAEEMRSKQPSVFTLVRAIVELFASSEDPHLGLYGAFGYDLAFQFEPIRLQRERPTGQRDLVLYLPDEIVVVDHRRERAQRLLYDFVTPDRSTTGLPRSGADEPYQADARAEPFCDHEPGAYSQVVRAAREAFRRGDLFEVVPGQTFFEPCPSPPSEVFRRLRERNPSPYGFLLNLGAAEYLVGASPEMYVRVDGTRVETCPISGTIARGQDPLGDADQILQLLNSRKDEAELTMCTDVDRNDKSRICEPGSVRVIGRRQIELYSRLIHTVDHVEGHLRSGFDALDAFLAHTWAVTVTGAPKAWAMQFLEDHERSPRAWYGGAVGRIGFDGNMNTGLTLRTIRLLDGIAQVRVGATLLFDSDPEDEERETRLKASAFLDAIRRPTEKVAPAEAAQKALSGASRRILLVDHEDSFVHTLANYLRQTGADVRTLRAGFPIEEIDKDRPDLVVLSPGPGRPSDFNVSATIAACLNRGLPIFGVCLGLQAVVEHFGGQLGVLPEPVHGKASEIHVLGGHIFEDAPRSFRAGRYHSLFALRESLPDCLTVTAETPDGVIMAVEHPHLPVAAVQFHPESILSVDGDVGLRLIDSVVRALSETAQRRRPINDQAPGSVRAATTSLSASPMRNG